MNESFPPSNGVTMALELLRSGSGKRAGGFSGRRVAYVLQRPRVNLGLNMGEEEKSHTAQCSATF